MAPGILAPEPSFTLNEMDKTAKEKHDFGAVIEDLDLNNISDADVKALADAIWTHKLVVVRGHQNLAPIKQWELVTRFDPQAPQVHSHGDLKTFHKTGGLLSKGREIYGIPSAENVRLIGKGHQGADHYGLKDIDIKKGILHAWHADAPKEEDFLKGHTRFQRWHIDAPLYARDPAWFTTLRCIQRPTAPELTIHWDDGSGLTMKTEPGLTAFFSNVQTYGMMTEDERQIADHSWVEYAPHPYQWMGDCKAQPTGLGLVSEGKEKTLGELGPYDEKNVKRYPMVWVNPVTGERAFMVHGICVRRAFLRSSETEEPRVVDDVAEIREWLKPIQERVLRPDYIMLPKVEEGDVVMWANYQVFHTAVDYPDHWGARTMHQANIGASQGPVGPVPIPSVK
ncbi:TauD Probable taurine catabolism dioxygenase [Pyrenophora tritici-repentis]|nr:Alpha-ketoglutarate dependent xanthine dioxygenase [Pyrenophora tritici-repentis]KAI1546433.1 TauD Probable taurine catabolism dioxygenase [Pyrenophora tritici-repentis]KAI1552610.1 TauD Probable taurine catabolism dioxygenase [Pyrenophora tritici-repentis]KAI1557123.1 TauD Probable taurine catabolism dioxygenase [Pyrenophora tritici-repentis]KAI1583426.1 TauD Probable taurine catabolism dioxygenase [Pyrenophora tritici-repentis]